MNVFKTFLLAGLLALPACAQPLLTLPAGANEWAVSPNGAQAGYWSPGQVTVGNQTVQADEIVVARNADGSPALFAPDSQTFAYAVRKGKKWTVVAGGKELAPPPDGAGSVTFLPNSHNLAYVIATPKGHAVSIAGQVWPLDAGTRVEGLRVSGDGRTAAFLCQKAGGWYIAMGSSVWRCQPGQRIVEAALNTDGSQLAWVEDGPKGKTLVLGGRRLGDYQEVKRIVFSPDGRRMCAVVVPAGGGNSVIVREDKEVLSKPGRSLDYPVWDKDSHEMVWGEHDGSRWTVWGRLNPAAPESLNAVPLAFTSDNKVVLLVLGSQQYLKAGDRQSAPFDALSVPVKVSGNSVTFGVRRGHEIYAETL